MAYIPKEKVRVVSNYSGPAVFGKEISGEGMAGVIICYIIGALLFSLGFACAVKSFAAFCIVLSIFAGFAGISFLRKWVDF